MKAGRRRPSGIVVLSATLLFLSACAPLTGGADAGTDAENLASFGADQAGSPAGNYLAGRFAQEIHDNQAAAAYLRQALAADPENVELLQRTELALVSGGQVDEAVVLARRLLKFDDESVIAILLVADAEAKAGDWAEIETIAQDMPKRGLGTLLEPLILAWARVGQGNVDSALAALATMPESGGFATMRNFHKALINDLADRRQAADEAYRATMNDANGATLRTAEAAIAFYRRIGRPERADEVLAAYRKAHPEAADLAIGAGLTQAVSSARQGLAEVLFGAAGSLRQARADDLALIFDRMVLDLAPDLALAQVMTADILQAMGRLEEADALFARVGPGSAVYWTAELRIAENLDQLGQVDEAARTLEVLAAQHPDRPEALVTLGDIMRGHKRWPEAISAYDRAIAMPSGAADWALFYARGIAYERSRQWPQAEADFLHALELAPDEPHVLNYLGYSWIDQGVRLAEARKMIEKAVEQRPNDGFIVDSLGWAYFRSGEFPKALAFLEKAVELHPEDATINDHLGDALWRMGRMDEARFQWQRAMNSDPEPDEKDELEHKLKNGLLPLTGAKNTAAK